MARERVQIGPAAGWIEVGSYESNFTPKIRGEITHLLHDVQLNAELSQSYVRIAMRLESQRAVQFQSQWRIGLDPQTQSIVLHSIKIRRGDTETEHVSLDRMQFLQRESGLERFTLQGSITLLLLLEDVRPGDILEYSYTVTSQSRVMPESFAWFFTLPMATEIGKYRFLVRHAESRPLKWKASSPKFVPKVTTQNGEVCCSWMDVDFVSPEPEGNTPLWQLMHPWIQVSDCPDWQTLARALANAWEKQLPGEGVAKMIAEIASFSPDLLTRVTRAIELVQDGFRYLSVNVELGGAIPAAPETVVRRCYGDCKDLAFLLVHLLRGLGVPARPVLVDAYLKKSVASMLPAAQMFNHVVVEYEIGNEKRWVDCTVKNQGGGALNRYIADFGVGLPIEAATTDLALVPKGSLNPGTHELRESFILDTSGKPSYLAIFITATGVAADDLRHEFANAGIDSLAKDHLQGCANRFMRAARIEPLRIRDDRINNEFVLAEAFEIQNTLLEHAPSRTCLFQIRSDFTAGLMMNPGLAPRRHPFALPYPCHRTHLVEIEFAGLNQITVPLFQSGNQYFSFNRRSRTWPNFLKLTFSLETLVDAIPADKQAEHRKNVEAIHEAATVNLQLPIGYSRARKPAGFGALPPPSPSRPGANSAVVMTQKPAAPDPKADAPAPTPIPETVAIERTAQAAGMATVKPMPPAREAIQTQTNPEKSRSSRSHRRLQKLEKRCAFSFYLFLLSLAALLTGFGFSIYGNKSIGGLTMLLVAIPAWICSLMLGIFGWKHFRRFPGRYTETSKLLVSISFAMGGLLGLIFIPALIQGFCAGFDRMRGQYYSANGGEEVLDFKTKNFIFHTPSKPWQQVDARSFGPLTTVGFRRPEPMCFTVVADHISPGLLDPRKQVADVSKGVLRQAATSYRVVSEQEVVYNGNPGLQIESEVSSQGHDFYFVQWVLATNGFGYQLTAWAPASVKTQLKDESGKLFADFELATAQPDPANHAAR